MPRYKIVLFVLAGLMFVISPALTSPAYAASIAGCYASLENNVLTIGNDRIRRTFEWNNGNLMAISIVNVQTGNKLVMQDRRPDISLGKLTEKIRSGQWSKRGFAMCH